MHRSTVVRRDRPRREVGSRGGRSVAVVHDRDERLRFLFGDWVVDEDVELDDDEAREELLADLAFEPEDDDSGGEGERLEAVSWRLRRAVAAEVGAQVLDDDPPEVWATALRLQAAGYGRRRILDNLLLAYASVLHRQPGEGPVGFDLDRYVAALACLPLPTADDAAGALLSLVAAEQPVGDDEAIARCAAQLGAGDGQDLVTSYVERLLDVLVRRGDLTYLVPDRLVAVDALTAGIVLTHRVTVDEAEGSFLDLGADLCGFARRGTAGPLTDGDGRVVDVAEDDGIVRWWFDDGLPGGLGAGDVVAVTVDGGIVCLERLAEAPELDPEVVRAIRASYDAETAEADMPEDLVDLVCATLVAHPGLFGRPEAPLGDLLAAAGLDLRGRDVACDEDRWVNARALRYYARLSALLAEVDESARERRRERAAQLLDAVNGRLEGVALRDALAWVEDPRALADVATVVVDGEGDLDELRRLHTRLRELTGERLRPRHAAALGWIAAVAAERAGDTLAALADLKAAVAADPACVPAVDRLAWYRSDQGDAAGAARLWRSIGEHPSDHQDLAEVVRFAAPTAKLGRNELCWCGSGRKYKACHLGVAQAPPLPERVGWLCRKAAAFLERGDGEARRAVFSLALTRAGGDTGGLGDAMADPLVLDVALLEGGWFERFLAERGPLLPNDEHLLASAWTLVPRTVYEVTVVEPGTSVQVTDLRTAETVDVRERAFSHQARPGMLICARAVPDGAGHQFIGAVFVVAPGREAELLDLLDGGDPHALVSWVAAAEAPPTLATREGEPLVHCTLQVRVPDPGEAAAVLDELYERDDPAEMTWREMHDIQVDDRIVRATLTLDGEQLAVSTSSEPRAERVLARLEEAFGVVEVQSDVREPFQWPTGSPEPVDAPEPIDLTSNPDVHAAVQAYIERYEQRWCDETIAALGGITPRQAAADPTRREQLERLLASFDRADIEGGLGMRAWRIRELLGLAIG